MAATQPFALEMVGLTKTFGDKAVLRGVDLQVKPGEVMFIVGTSGVGKSVTIKHVIGLLRADGGQIRLFGQSGPHDRPFYLRRRLATCDRSCYSFACRGEGEGAGFGR